MDKFVDQEFLEYLVKSIVDHPDDVKLERTVDERGVLIRLKVHVEDMGQVVGRQGATAKAIRSLLRIVGIKNNAQVNLKIEEPEGSTHVPRERREGGAPAGGGQASPETPRASKIVDGPIADELAL
jgi:predicted RNA-binding protein YlqC (UPF0109 family)